MNLRTYIKQLDFVKRSNGIVIVSVSQIKVNFVPVLIYLLI